MNVSGYGGRVSAAGIVGDQDLIIRSDGLRLCYGSSHQERYKKSRMLILFSFDYPYCLEVMSLIAAMALSERG